MAALAPSCFVPPGHLVGRSPFFSQHSAPHVLGRRQWSNRLAHSSVVAARTAEVSKPLTPSHGSDFFVLELADRLEDCPPVATTSADAKNALGVLREVSAEIALNCHWPTRRDEAYRFTDLSLLKKSNIEPCCTEIEDIPVDISTLELGEPDTIRVIFVDGIFSSKFSCLDGIPDNVYIGSISALPTEKLNTYVLPKLEAASTWVSSDVFAALNGVGTRDLGVILIPENVALKKPVHVIYWSSHGSIENDKKIVSLSSPRLLLVAEKNAEVELVEEHVGAIGATYFANSVCEIAISEGAKVSHSYVQAESNFADNIKKTYVYQNESSFYTLVDIGLGGRLARHNLQVDQLGPDTSTEISTFHLAGSNQLQDLHSKIILSHPRGYSRQLHKCIVMSPSGHAVFDGNVKVNRNAQQTDAGQLSRSLLLAPKATVNVKPNLQIVADDVKCSHGAAISDLEEEQLFYFRARGIDLETARSALVYSFGAEVIARIRFKDLQKRIENTLKASLAAEGVINVNIPLGR